MFPGVAAPIGTPVPETSPAPDKPCAPVAPVASGSPGVPAPPPLTNVHASAVPSPLRSAATYKVPEVVSAKIIPGAVVGREELKGAAVPTITSFIAVLLLTPVHIIVPLLVTLGSVTLVVLADPPPPPPPPTVSEFMGIHKFRIGFQAKRLFVSVL